MESCVFHKTLSYYYRGRVKIFQGCSQVVLKQMLKYRQRRDMFGQIRNLSLAVVRVLKAYVKLIKQVFVQIVQALSNKTIVVCLYPILSLDLSSAILNCGGIFALTSGSKAGHLSYWCDHEGEDVHDFLCRRQSC